MFVGSESFFLLLSALLCSVHYSPHVHVCLIHACVKASRAGQGRADPSRASAGQVRAGNR